MERRANELKAAGRLAGEALETVVDVVADVHEAVLGRLDGLLPEMAQPVNTVQGAVTSVVYAGVALGHRLAPRAAGAVLALTGGEGATAPSETTVGRAILAGVHGLWGSAVTRGRPELDVVPGISVPDPDGAHPGTALARWIDVELDAPSVAKAFPAPSARLVVFLAGLGEDVAVWHQGRRPPQGEPAGSYGNRLQRDLGVTAVHLRYNSGYAVAHNGRAVSRILDRLVSVWPVPVTRIDVVGHSMGGLVAGAACADATSAGAGWIARAGTVVTLGTPHGGAPLAKAVHAAERVLARAPETAPLGRLLGARSPGVRDLRRGDGVPPLPPHVRYRYVTATLTRSLGHPVGVLLGDGLVRRSSATGGGGAEAGAHLAGRHHFSLLDDAQVYARLLEWLR